LDGTADANAPGEGGQPNPLDCLAVFNRARFKIGL